MPTDDAQREARWRRVAEALDAAFASGGDPETELRRRLADAPDLLDIALAALREAGDPESVSNHAPGLLAELGGSVDDAEDRRWAGRRLGAYRIVRPLGRGGMGAVFLAERADGQFERQVAVKILPWSAQGCGLVERFAEERRILATLDHPAIARLLDGGIAGDGTPYLVLEYVDGLPVHRYCEARGLDARARLELFLTICDAVRFAHRNLVVHRDIKPGNILVTPGGRVKLLDADSRDARTAGLNFLTPDYAAPEQLRGDPVTTSTDVYALGVLLFRLLAGRVPLELSDRSLAEVVEAVCHTEPPGLAAAAAASGSPPADPRSLRGDLAAITARAMDKEPTRRYDSVAALADDVRRHLEGLPVRAHADSLVYRAGKFLRRHRLGLATATAVFLALAALAGAALWQAHERDLAAHRAETVSDFLVTLFRAADPGQSQGETVTARDLFEQGVARVSRELADAPAVRADVLLTLAAIAERLGEFDRGTELARESLELRHDLYGAESGETADALRREGALLVLKGQLAPGRDSLESALALDRRLQRPASVAADLEELASLELTRDDPDAAARLLEEAIGIRRSLAGEEAALQVARGQLAMARRQQGRLEEADSLYREVLPALRATLGPRHPETVAARTNFAALLGHQGRYEEAAEQFRALIGINRELYSDTHPQVITARNNLAAMLARQGEHAAAESEFRDLLEYWRDKSGRDHPRTLGTQVNLAVMLERQGELAEAGELYRDALARFRRVLGPQHPYVAVALGHLADIASSREQWEEAWRMAEEALAIRRSARGVDHPAVAVSLHQLGDISLARGHPDEARSYYERAWELRRSRLGPEHPETRASRQALEQAGSPPDGPRESDH